METFPIQRREKAEDFVKSFRPITGKDFKKKIFYEINKKLLGGKNPGKHVLVPGDIVFIPTGVTAQFVANVVHIQRWDLGDIAEAVASKLGTDRNGKCILACRLIMATCGNVKCICIQDEQLHGHWWTEFVTSKGDTIYIDVTAVQFYPNLGSVYKENPCESPLFAETTGAEMGVVDGSECGRTEISDGDKSEVLIAYRNLDRGLTEAFHERHLTSLHDQFNMN